MSPPEAGRRSAPYKYFAHRAKSCRGTATFLRALGPEPWRAAYVQPSRRPKDARYGENPNRLHQHHQFQVVLKPAPTSIVDLYLAAFVRLALTRK